MSKEEALVPAAVPRLQAQVREDLLDHRLLQDGGEDLWLAPAAVERIGCIRGRGTGAFSRCMNSSSDITRRVVPSRQGVFSFNTTWTACNRLSPYIVFASQARTSRCTSSRLVSFSTS